MPIASYGVSIKACLPSLHCAEDAMLPGGISVYSSFISHEATVLDPTDGFKTLVGARCLGIRYMTL